SLLRGKEHPESHANANPRAERLRTVGRDAHGRRRPRRPHSAAHPWTAAHSTERIVNVQEAPSTDPRSLEEVHGSVAIPRTWWRRFLAFSGPALMVSVGYMDPGNWGTDLSAGSKYGYQLLWVLLTSNLMAVLLQTLATRLGVVAGRDLAQACR